MSRVSFPHMAKAVVLTFTACLLLAAPARADLITLNFQGSVDLTSEGFALYPYSGHFTWNTASLPFETSPGEASYALWDYSLVFNGSNVTVPVSSDGRGNGLAVENNADPLGIGTLDALAFYAPAIDFGTSDLILIGILRGPITMFNSTALPTNTNFLGQTTPFTAFLLETDAPNETERFLDTFGTLNITGQQVTPSPVPEPTSMLLLGTGLAGAGMRRWRKSRINR